MDHPRSSRPLAFTPRTPANLARPSTTTSAPYVSPLSSTSATFSSPAPHVLVQPSPVAPPAPFKIRGTDSLAEAWKTWRQTWDAYSVVTRLTAETSEYRVAMLLSVIGPFGVRMFNGLPFASAAEKNSIDRVLTLFAAKCVGETNIVYERYLFLDRRQSASEDFEDYLTDLKAIVQRCDYGRMEDELLRDRIVHGIVNDAVRKRLLGKSALTLEKCVAICRSDKQTSIQAKTMRRAAIPPPSDELHAVASSSRAPSQREPRAQSAAKNVPGRKNASTPAPAPSSRDSTTQRRVDCHYCGLNHIKGRKHCSAVGHQCSRCGGVDHFPRVCRSRNPRRDQVQQIDQTPISDDGESDEQLLILTDNDSESVHALNDAPNSSIFPKKLFALVDVNNHHVTFQLDSGATCNVIRERDLPPNAAVQPTTRTLSLYDRSALAPIGQISLRVRRPNTAKWFRGSFLVVQGSSPSILGSSSSQQMGYISVNRELLHNTDAVAAVSIKEDSLSKDILLVRFPEVFEDALGTFPEIQHLDVDPTVAPSKIPTRRVPVAVKDALRDELARLESQGIISRVTDPTPWVSAYLAVPKSNGRLRLCLDPKPLNRALQRSHYHMPTLDDVLSELANAKVFSVADVRNGFWHVLLAATSRLFTTFGTPFGRYCWNRLPFGIAPAPEIFQRHLAECLEGLEGVYIVADDVLIVGKGDDVAVATLDHDKKLCAFLDRCKKKDIKLNLDKLQLRVSSVSYLGHRLTAAGLQPHPHKVAAIQNMLPPGDVSAVRRLLGVVNYLSRFVPHLADLCLPLRALTHNGAAWQWTDREETSFKEIKTALSSPPVLRFFDAAKSLSLQCDASDTGLGATLMQDGQPIAYASATLTRAQQSYAQIEKELLTIVFGLEHFHQFTYGRLVHIETDHKPLESIVCKPLYNAPRRLQRLLLHLLSYDTVVTYRKGSELYLADTLSRAPLRDPSFLDSVNLLTDLSANHHTDDLSSPVLTEIREFTLRDASLQALIHIIQSGWPDSKNALPDAVKPYYADRVSLTVYDDIVYYGSRVLVPQELRPSVTRRLHKSHIGINACVRRAADVLYWPGFATHLRDVLAACDICRSFDVRQQKESLHSHAVPTRPWAKVGADLFHFDGNEYLVLVDYYSNYVIVCPLTETQSSDVIEAFQTQFATYGIPDVLFTDNGPQFSSHRFRQFASDWFFLHMTRSPGYPQSNGKAENAVRTVKRLWRKALADGQDKWLALLAWRNSPTEGFSSSPAQHFLSRRTRTLLPTADPLLQPSISPLPRDAAAKAKATQARYYNRQARDLPPLQAGDSVRIQPPTTSAAWGSGRVVDVLPNRSYVVETADGSHLRRNRRHLRRSNGRSASPVVASAPSDGEASKAAARSPSPIVAHSSPPLNTGRPRRNRRRPAHLQDYVTDTV